MTNHGQQSRQSFLDRFHRCLVAPFFGNLCWMYDLAAWVVSGGMWKRWTFSAEQFLAGEPILEVGCGRGHLLARLAQRGISVIGMDASPRMVAASRQRLVSAGLTAQVLCAQAERMPFADASFGTVISTFPAEYVKDEATWRECARVLRSGGRWVIVETPLLDGFQFRLLGMYLAVLTKFGTLAPVRRPSPIGIAAKVFPVQRREVVQVGPTRVIVTILEK